MDIVDRLRRYAGDVLLSTPTELAAADEIERLRKELEYANLAAEAEAQRGDALKAELDALKSKAPVGVFADVNRHVPGQPPRWEQMVPESWDGVEYVYLYAAPKPGEPT